MAKPPKAERAAETLVRRARSLTAAASCGSESAERAASAMAAKADALEASPAEVGKSLSLTTAARSAVPVAERTRSSKPLARARAAGGADAPFNVSVSASSEASKRTEVVVRIPARVTERLGTAGRL